MDDSRFDDLLRKKLKDHHDPSFDPESLDDLHERMQGHTFTHWYSNRAMQMAMVVLLLLSGSNVYFILSNQKLQQQLLTGNIQNQKINYSLYDDKIDSLNKVISQLQCESETRPVEYINTKTTNPKSPDFWLKLITVADYKTSENPTQYSTLKLGMGRVNDLPSNTYQQLKEKGWLIEENGDVFLNLAERNNHFIQTSIHTDPKDLLASPVETGSFRIVSIDAKQEEKKVVAQVTRQGESSLKARNALEKHYYKGIGIQLAPHIDLMKGIYSEGQGQITPRVGITADWILSPHISLESGLDYSSTGTIFHPGEINAIPDYSPNETLESAELTNKLFSTPIAFKYRRWISDRSQVLLRTSLTPYWSLSRTYQYNFTYPDPNPDADVDRLTTIDKKDQFKFYGTTVGTSLGLTLNREKNKGTWEVSLFYERSLGSTTDQNIMQLFGLRTAHWFKIK